MLRPVICLLVCAWPAWGLAAPPTISDLSVHGLQVGGTTRLTVSGANLLPSPRVVAGVPIAKQVVVGKPTANAVILDVTLGGDVRPGVYHLRAVSGQGVSTPRVITVDRLPQKGFVDSARLDALPVALHGRLVGSTVASVRFSGRADQVLTVGLMARRLGSALRPVLHLLGPDGRRMKLAMPRSDLGGDTRFTITVPRDGLYTLKWHDLQYAGAGPGDFRLSIGRFDTADLVYPPAVTLGKAGPVLLLGTGGREIAAGVIESRQAGGLVPVGWAENTVSLGLRPTVEVSRWPEVIEPAKAETPRRLPSVPSAASGRLIAAGESDSWRVPVKQGEKLRFEVFADRLGSPLDSMLELKKPDGGDLAANDDAVRSDSRIDFTVPADLSHLLAVVSDRHGRGGRRYLYRLAVTRTTDPAVADFDLVVASNSYNVLPGGRHVFRVDVVRRGYNGEIRLDTIGAPSHFRLLTPSIPAGAPGVLVTVVNTSSEGKTALDGFRLVGRSTAGGTSVQRPVRIAAHPLASSQPWLREDLVVGRSVPPSPVVAIDVKPASTESLWRGQEVPLPIQLSRDPEAVGPVRLSLVTSQKVPLVKGKPNAGAAIRGAAATIDIPVSTKVKAALDAATKARAAVDVLEKKVTAAGGADAALKGQLVKARVDRDAKVKVLRKAVATSSREAVYRVIVPPGLPLVDYDLSVVAELRSMDNKTALARSFSPVRRLTARRSLEIVARDDSVVRASRTAKSDAIVRLRGEIIRHGRFGGDVTVTIAGQPKGIPVPKVVVKAGASGFELPLKVPAGFAAAQIANLALVVKGPANPKAPKILVEARQPFSLLLSANGKSTPPPPPSPRTLGR